jgi:hypothetical protein
MIITRISTKSALGAVVTWVPAITDLDLDPCQVIRTGDWVRVEINWAVTSAGTLDETTVMHKLQHLDITRWASCGRAPRLTTRTSPRCSPRWRSRPDSSVTLYNK